MNQAQTILDNWGSAFRSGDPDEMTALYSPNASLWGTVSGVQRVGPDAIHDYFAGLFSRFLCDIKFHDGYFREVSGLIFASGRYDFELKKRKKAKTICGRYSFVFEFQGDCWKIVEHHSSIVPLEMNG